MIDESLIKSNFLGRDGFRWWIGQVPPLSTQGGQPNGAGWGNRFKVRIMGYHPYNTVELKDEDLPWAQCLLPTTTGTGAGNNATNVKISGGDTVFGFFLDGDNAQIPVIMGCFGRTSQVPSSTYKGPFQPFTGYTDKVKKPNGTLKPDQSNEQNAATQKSPRHVSPSQAKSVGKDEISYFSGIGDVVQFGSSSSGSTVNKIATEVGNFVNMVQGLTDNISKASSYVKSYINQEIDKITKKISGIVSGLVGGIINKSFKALAPILNQGLKLLYKLVYNLVLAATQNSFIAHKAGVAAQTAMVGPISAIQKLIPTLAGSIVSSIGNVVKGMLNSVVDNVSNFVTCAANQFTGSLMNSIIGKITSAMSGPLGAVQNILQFFGGFSLDNLIRSDPGVMGEIGSSGGCGDVTQWVIGKGAKQTPGVKFEDILKTANTAIGIAQGAGAVAGSLQSIVGSMDLLSSSAKSAGFKSALGDCYVGPPLSCSPPKIKIFGGGGSGAEAVPIFGSIVGTGSNKTASIIGATILNAGSGYEFPPFVEIVDDCNKGYGAVGYATISDDGKVKTIYFVSEGENYTPDEVKPVVPDSVIIIDPGNDYTPGDKAKDQYGNEYNLDIDGGQIYRVTPLNTLQVTDLPIITIESDTGSGAILKVNLKNRPLQTEVEKVIDCIT